MNEPSDDRPLGPPDVVGNESSRYFRKVVNYVIFWRSHWTDGRQCRHIVDAESSRHLSTAAATGRDRHRASACAVARRGVVWRWFSGYAIRDCRRRQSMTRARIFDDDCSETNFGLFDREFVTKSENHINQYSHGLHPPTPLTLCSNHYADRLNFDLYRQPAGRAKILQQNKLLKKSWWLPKNVFL